MVVSTYELFILWLQMEKRRGSLLPYQVDHTELLEVLCSPEFAAWKTQDNFSCLITILMAVRIYNLKVIKVNVQRDGSGRN
jgi:hypothetical protein